MILIDTSGFLCLNYDKEPHYEKAVELYNAAAYRVTTNYVLAEYIVNCFDLSKQLLVV